MRRRLSCDSLETVRDSTGERLYALVSCPCFQGCHAVAMVRLSRGQWVRRTNGAMTVILTILTVVLIPRYSFRVDEILTALHTMRHQTDQQKRVQKINLVASLSKVPFAQRLLAQYMPLKKDVIAKFVKNIIQSEWKANVALEKKQKAVDVHVFDGFAEDVNMELKLQCDRVVDVILARCVAEAVQEAMNNLGLE